MANETVVRVTADSTGYSAGMDKAKRSAEAFLQSQEAAAQRTKVAQAAITESVANGANASARSINQFVAQMARMADSVGKTRSQLLEQKAAQLGVTSSVSDYIAKIKGAETSTANLGGVSKETAFALRMLPAQFTDIATQLAGGQSPFMILMQQGGQIKDMFGGIGPALRAVGGYVAGLINPFTLAAAAVGVLTFAYEKGAAEAEAYNKSLTLTGGYAGVSANQLQQMAQSIGATVGTTGKAADALNQLVATGKVTGSAIKDIGEAAVAMQEATGQAIDKTIKDYVSLADKPTEAIVQLNNQYHFLTAAVEEQIAALERQGNKEQAAALAQQTYSSAMKNRADEVVQNVGYMERAWNALWSKVTKTWDAMKGVGRDSTLAEQLASINAKIAAAQSSTFGIDTSKSGLAFWSGSSQNLDALRAQRDEIQRQLDVQAKEAQAKAQLAKDNDLAIDAQTKINKLLVDGADSATKERVALKALHDQLEAIRKVNPNSSLLLPSNVAAAEKAIRDQYAKKGGGATDKDPLGTFIKGEDIQYQLKQYQEYLDYIGTATAKKGIDLKALHDQWMNDALQAGEISLNEYYKTIDGMSSYTSDKMGEMGQFGKQAARNIQSTLGDGLYNMLKGNFSDIASSFTDMLLKMAANAASINLGNAIFGGNFDKTGQVGGLLGSIVEAIWPTTSVGNLTGSSLSGATWNSSIGTGSTSLTGIGTFDSGGYTGSGDKYDEAGIVHKGEFVFNKESTDRIGVSNLYRMMRGYASGGLVGGSAVSGGMPTPATINLINQSGQPLQARSGGMSFDGKGYVQNIILTDLRTNGPITRGLKGAMA